MSVTTNFNFASVLSVINCYVYGNSNAFHSTGRVPDSSYASSKIYSYIFDAGVISTYPDVNITITDDVIGEFNKTFQIVITNYSLPFYVKAGLPATIFTNNSDSK